MEDLEEESLMKRVKYFDAENPDKLEREINEFLSETEVTYVDMKFQSEKSLVVISQDNFSKDF